MSQVEETRPEPQALLLPGGQFYFGEPVTDPYGQGWTVFDVSPDGNVFVTRGRATAVFLACQLTRVRTATTETAEEPAAAQSETPRQEPSATGLDAANTTTQRAVPARRITVKRRTAEMWEAISRGTTYLVVLERRMWTVIDPTGERIAVAGWEDAPDAARVRAAVREDLARVERENSPETAARAEQLLAEVRTETVEETAAANDVVKEPAVEAADPELDDVVEEFDPEAWRKQYLAERTAPGLHWTVRHLETVEHAAAAGIVAEGGAYRRREGGRRIAAALVDGLTGAGFLAAAENGRVRATADGVEAVRRIRMVPSALMTAEDFTTRARRVMRANQSLSPTAQRGRVLPCLPGGDEHRRRQQAAREWRAEWDRQAAIRQAEIDAIDARHAAEDLAATQARKAADAEAEQLRKYGCGQCPDTWVLEARCGACRTAFFPAPHQPELPAADDAAEQPAPAAQASGRTYVTVRTFTDHGHTQGRLEFAAARGWRATEHRAAAAELARLYGLRITVPRRLLADGTHRGAELTRRLDVAGTARTMSRYLDALPRVIAELENLATRAARRFGTWRRSLMTVLSGVLGDQSPAEVKGRARAFRSAVLARLVSSMAQGPEPVVGDDVRAPLWERAAAMAAEVWAVAPVDPWENPGPGAAPSADSDVHVHTAETSAPRQAPAATGRHTVTVVDIDQPTPTVALAA
ncbi:hypothetical protein ACWCQL_13130 [Streptomyces sp. NPDC002073]